MTRPKNQTPLSEAPLTQTQCQTHSGLYIDYLNPRCEHIKLRDMALGLARECRFNGQTREFYSVAQHSVLASLLVPQEMALYALLHDGSEAYLRDIATPLKILLPDYQVIEKRVQDVILRAFGLAPMPTEVADTVKEVDARLFATERNQLMPHDGRCAPGTESLVPYDFKIKPMAEHDAFQYFLERFREIKYPNTSVWECAGGDAAMLA